MSWRKKLVFSAIVTLTFFVALEVMLATFGVKPVTDVEDPFVGFSNQQPLMHLVTSGSGERELRTSTNKLVWFNDQSFPAAKAAQTKRVFCVGGSTTYGRPYWDATSYVGWLRELLPIVEPSVQWEVINAGGVSYASYRVAAVMQELAAYEPDLFVVYCGQNEFLERRTYHDFFERSSVQTDLQAMLARTRVWALAQRVVGRSRAAEKPHEKSILPGEVDEILNHSIGPADYHRDEEWKAAVVGHYERNLLRMIWIAESAGAEIVFVTPASNEKDCSPFKSEFHRDEHKIADFQYRLGGEHFARGEFDEARDSFRGAINEDVCPLRAIDSIVEAIERVVVQRDVPLVDFPALLREKCEAEYGHSCLGQEYFLDHVHPDNATHRQLALWILDTLQRNAMIPKTKLDSKQIDRVADRIDAKVDRGANGVALRNLAKVLHWSGKFSEALPLARDALDLLPDDSASIAVLADCLAQWGDHEAALLEYERLFRLSPGHVKAFLPYGEVLIRQGDFSRARVYLLMAIAEDEPNARAPYFLGVAESELGNLPAAIDSFQQSHRMNRDYPETISWIAKLYAEQGEVKKGIHWYKKAVAAAPNDVDSRFRLGMLLLKDSEIESAVEQFERVLQIDPSHAGAKVNTEIVRQLQ